jgi:hypothetical protein
VPTRNEACEPDALLLAGTTLLSGQASLQGYAHLPTRNGGFSRHLCAVTRSAFTSGASSAFAACAGRTRASAASDTSPARPGQATRRWRRLPTRNAARERDDLLLAGTTFLSEKANLQWDAHLPCRDDGLRRFLRSIAIRPTESSGHFPCPACPCPVARKGSLKQARRASAGCGQ